VSVGHLCVFFGKKSIQVLLPIFKIELFGFFLVLSCRSSSYILYINPLLDISLANIFSHSKVAFFVVDGFLHCAKAFYFGVPKV